MKIYSNLFVTAGMLILPAVMQAQLNVNGAQLFIESGAAIYVQGDVTATTDILGPGKILLSGSTNQNLNMNGFTIPVLEINNTANATLTGDLKIGTSLIFTNGKIKTGNYNFTLSDVATFSGAGTNKFLETNGTGQVFKEIASNISSKEIPVGAGSSYRPAFITTTGTYSSAKVGVKVLGAASPNKPAKISDYIKAYWPVTKSGISGTVTIKGQYIDGSDVTGSEGNLRGYFFNGTDWSSSSETHNAGANQISAIIASNSGQLTALDKFDLLKSKIFLQGAYNTSTGVMNDGLRSPTNVIPLSDPYRTAPYSTQFTHVANTVTETVPSSVFNNQASSNNDIVDWVFIELRNNAGSPGNSVLQTRSALLQRDGDIVDIDGVSLVTFNNTASDNYTISVRHRNHLGISTNPAVLTPALDETKSTAALVDLTSASDAQLYGTSTAFVLSSGKNLLWAGDANGNAQVKYQGPSNDRANILSALVNNELGTKVGYERADLNMNGQVKYQGPSNDRAFILSSVLLNAELSTKSQQLPN